MSVPTIEALPSWAHELLAAGRVAHLGILDDDGRPRVQPVTFAVLDGVVWSAIDDKPKRRPGEQLARVRRLRARPDCALTVDRYDDDWQRLAWVQVLGEAAVLDIAGQERALAALAARYAPYRETPPSGPLLRIAPRRVLCWRAGD